MALVKAFTARIVDVQRLRTRASVAFRRSQSIRVEEQRSQIERTGVAGMI